MYVAEHAEELMRLRLTVDSLRNRDREAIKATLFVTSFLLLLSAVSFFLFGYSFCVIKWQDETLGKVASSSSWCLFEASAPT